jgi:hypothetical protein
VQGPIWVGSAIAESRRCGHLLLSQHAALAQMHRLYQIYESPDPRIENALDILTPDIKLKSGHRETVDFIG